MAGEDVVTTTLAGYEVIEQSGNNGSQLRITTIKVAGVKFEVNEYSDSIQVSRGGDKQREFRYIRRAYLGFDLFLPNTWFRRKPTQEEAFRKLIEEWLAYREPIAELLSE